MEPLIFALTVTCCLAGFSFALGSIFVGFVFLHLTDHSAGHMPAPGGAPARAAYDGKERELAVDPHDALRTDHFLTELIATRGLEDW